MLAPLVMVGVLAAIIIAIGVGVERGCRERMRTTEAIIERKRAAREAIAAERDRVNSIPGFAARKLAQRKLRAQDKIRYNMRHRSF